MNNHRANVELCENQTLTNAYAPANNSLINNLLGAYPIYSENMVCLQVLYKLGSAGESSNTLNVKVEMSPDGVGNWTAYSYVRFDSSGNQVVTPAVWQIVGASFGVEYTGHIYIPNPSRYIRVLVLETDFALFNGTVTINMLQSSAGSFFEPMLMPTGASITNPAFVSPIVASSISGPTNRTASATNITLQASNANRKGLIIQNSITSDLLYVNLGATASASAWVVQLAPGAYWEMPTPVYTGAVNGIWASATGFCQVTEIR